MRITSHLLLLVSLLALAACKPATTQPINDASKPVEDDQPAAIPAPPASVQSTGPELASVAVPFAKKIGAQCEDTATDKGCVIGNMDAGDFYDVELTPMCGADGFFAATVDDGTSLLSTLPVTGSTARVNAKLPKDQFLCIQAIARTGQQPAYYYVAAISPSNVKACEGNDICARYDDHPIHIEARSSSGADCTLNSNAVAGDNCAQGWINAGSVEAFSNGL